MNSSPSSDAVLAPAPAPAPDSALRLRRHPERGSTRHEAIHAVLDQHWVCQIAFVHEGIPHVLPTAYWRDGEHLYIHGSNGSRMIKMLVDGESCTNVTLVDGLVLARSAFSHSANYRSVNIYGRYRALEDVIAKQQAFQRFFEIVLPGRWPQVRQPDAKEIAATTVLRIDLQRAVLKARSGGPVDASEDQSWPCWAGVLPFALGSAAPLAAADACGDFPEATRQRWQAGHASRLTE